MNTFTTTATILTHSMAWALLHSLWQGLLIFGTLYTLLKAMPNANSRTKYYLALGAFAGLFTWFADTWVEQYQRLKGITVFITQAGGDVAATTYTTKVFDGHVQGALLHKYLPGIEQYFPYLLIIYSCGLAFMLMRFVLNIMQVRSLRTHGIAPLAPKYHDLLSQCMQRLEIGRPVSMFLSHRISVPMMLGVLKPVILLPVATLNHLSMEELEAILSHELAHIRRHDYLVNMLQTIAETMLFFNPFVWLISRIIRKEREHCCDDLVVANSATPLHYAKALAILEGNRYNNNKLAMAATGNKNQLFHRIKRIMEMKKNNLNYGQITIIIVALIAVLFTAAMFTFSPSFAQKLKKGETTDTTKKSVYRYKTVTIDKNGKRTEEEQVSDKPIKGKMDEEDNGDVVVSYSDGDSAHAKRVHKVIVDHNTVINIDGDEISKNVQEVMKKVQKEFDAVDWEQINEEINKGLGEVNKQLNDKKFRKQISVEIRKEMENAKDELEKAKKEIKKYRIVRVDDGDDEAMPPMPPTAGGFGSRQVYAGTNDYETMLKRMEKDGLINRDDNYKIEKDNDELFINGKKQPEAVYNKYESYLKYKSVQIKGHKGHLAITIND